MSVGWFKGGLLGRIEPRISRIQGSGLWKARNRGLFSLSLLLLSGRRAAVRRLKSGHGGRLKVDTRKWDLGELLEAQKRSLLISEAIREGRGTWEDCNH